MSGTPEISVVVPFYNEADAAAAVVDELAGVLTQLGRTFEIVLVDDGSTDGTADVLIAAGARWPCCRLLQHASNAGQGAALWHGLRAARGAVLVTLDGDGQNDPAELPGMLARLAGPDAHADVVLGIRVPRADPPVRRAMSLVANTVRRRWLQDGASDTGCAIRVFRREALAGLLPIQSLHSFIPAFVTAAGHSTIEVPVRHRPRRAGRSHYGLRAMLWRPFIDMLAIGWLQHRRIPQVEVREIPLGTMPEASAPPSRARSSGG